MAFKMKGSLKFGQKTAFKMKSYSPSKQRKSTESAQGQINDAEKDYKIDKGRAEKSNSKLKEFLIENKGFNQADADRMIADGAYSYRDMMKEMGMYKDVAAEPKGKGSESKAPLEQEGPIPKKNIGLQPGEMEGTYLYGHNYGDEDIPGKGEGFEPSGTKDQKFTAQERIIDLEDRAGFLTDNDIPDLEGSTDPKDIKRLKTLKTTVKKLQSEANILRKRRDNETKSSSSKMKSPAKQGLILSPDDRRKPKKKKIRGIKKIVDKKAEKVAKIIKKKVSPNKQTKSGKGNIFTKKGRNQKVVNRHARLTKKQLESNAKLDEYGTVKELNKFGRISRRKKRTEKKLEKRGIKVTSKDPSKGKTAALAPLKPLSNPGIKNVPGRMVSITRVPQKYVIPKEQQIPEQHNMKKKKRFL